MEYNVEKFKNGLEKLKIGLSKEQIQQFLCYYELLIEKNKVMNLTGITDYEEVIEKHFLDSLSLCQVCDLSKSIKILDMGTGAGFPGVPLKIAFPEIEMTLADSLNKRVKFLEEVIQNLGLKKVEVIHARAEELAKNKEYREQFDVVVSRAVANLSTLGEYCVPFVKVGGFFISYKSGEIEAEAEQAKKAVAILGGQTKEIFKFELSDQKRSFVIVEKVKTTPKAYPRKAGTPAKLPL